MDISFSDRLSNIMILQNLLALHASNGDFNAKELEESAYSKAKSKVGQFIDISIWKRLSDLNPRRNTTNFVPGLPKPFATIQLKPRIYPKLIPK